MAAVFGNDPSQQQCTLNMRVGVSECVPFRLYVCIKECGFVYVVMCKCVSQFIHACHACLCAYMHNADGQVCMEGCAYTQDMCADVCR